jgi:predicted DsbA family dithiol-disulfide isomerase
MQIEVFHDTACPWCRIGKRHLQLALQQWDGEPVSVRYRTFFLNEAIPQEGHDFRSYMLAKGNGQVPLEQFFDGPRRAGAAVDLDFNFEQISRAPNTMLSHRLIALTPDDHKEALIDAVYDAYFQHGQDIGDISVLLGIAQKHGFDRATVEAQLRGDMTRDIVLMDARWAQRHGVTGVPFFTFDNIFAISGAQPPETILQAMQHTVDHREVAVQDA